MVLSVVVVLGAIAGSGEARAADAGEPKSDTSDTSDTSEVTTLEAQLGRETSELATSDCAAACRALASIQRAADRICELEPGPRCAAAREKADAASKRVREACPDCALASAPPKPLDDRAVTPSPSESHPAAAPPPEAERGGCRSCTTTARPPTSGDLLLFAALAALVRRRKKRV
ncbi:MAG: hypothetical protein KIT84_31550 [Labilithrix sp.]|nr:hypothetical protein [Labilithrix sp.]